MLNLGDTGRRGKALALFMGVGMRLVLGLTTRRVDVTGLIVVEAGASLSSDPESKLMCAGGMLRVVRGITLADCGEMISVNG